MVPGDCLVVIACDGQNWNNGFLVVLEFFTNLDGWSSSLLGNNPEAWACYLLGSFSACIWCIVDGVDARD